MTKTPNLLHKELLEELQLTTEQLAQMPKPIKAKLAAIDGLLQTYASSPTEELFEKIEHASALLWHSIKDWSERDLPDEEETPPAPPAAQPIIEENPVIVEEVAPSEESSGRRFVGRFHERNKGE